MKYSFVPQTEAPYKMDRYSPVDWSASEPEKVRIVMMMIVMMMIMKIMMMMMMLQVTVLMPSTRFLLPRDSLSKIVTGQVNWGSMEQASKRQLIR